MGFRNYIDKVKRYYGFTSDELKGFIVTILIFGILLTFNDWGDEEFNASIGLWNLFQGVIIVLISLFIFHSVRKLSGLVYGYRVVRKPVHIFSKQSYGDGLFISAFITILTNGTGLLLWASSFDVEPIKKHRLGSSSKSHHARLIHIGYLALFGFLANALLASIALFINSSYPSFFWKEMILFNTWYIVWNLIPLPSLDGGKLFFASRTLYVFGVFVLFSYLISTMIGTPSIIVSLGIGITAAIIFYFLWEKGWR